MNFLSASNFKECPNPPPRFAGLSSIAFLIPALVDKHLFIPLLVQTVVSYMSDYVTCGRTSYWHALDRVYAKVMFAYVVRLCTKYHGLYPTLVSMLPALVFYILARFAVGRNDIKAYNVFHGGWHIAIGVTSAYMLSYKNE